MIANYSLLNESIKRDDIIIIEGTLRLDDYTNRLNFRAKSINSLEDARIILATGVKFKITKEEDLSILVEKLETLFSNKEEKGKCAVRIDYMSSGITKSLVLGENYKILPTNDIITELKKLDCVEKVELIYSSM